MLKTILTLALGCASFSAHAQDCRQSWRHGDGRLLIIHESFAIGAEGRGFIGTVGEQSYIVIRQVRAAATLSYASTDEWPESDAAAPRRADRRALPPARADQTLDVDDGPLLGRWTGEGCRVL